MAGKAADAGLRTVLQVREQQLPMPGCGVLSPAAGPGSSAESQADAGSGAGTAGVGPQTTGVEGQRQEAAVPSCCCLGGQSRRCESRGGPVPRL